MVHAQKKGKVGEREFCKWLAENFDIEADREYNQSSGNSADIIINDFIFEIKRRETLSLDEWWYQVICAQKAHTKKTGKELIPIVAYRKNGKKEWTFLVPAKLLAGCEIGYLIASEIVFKQFARGIIR